MPIYYFLTLQHNALNFLLKGLRFKMDVRDIDVDSQNNRVEEEIGAFSVAVTASDYEAGTLHTISHSHQRGENHSPLK